MKFGDLFVDGPAGDAPVHAGASADLGAAGKGGGFRERKYDNVLRWKDVVGSGWLEGRRTRRDVTSTWPLMICARR